jgi:hypothetical protein
VSSPDHHSPDNRGIDWPAVVRTLVIQVAVLTALAVAFIGYVNWSSERAFSEFMSATERPLLGSPERPCARRPRDENARHKAGHNAYC